MYIITDTSMRVKPPQLSTAQISRASGVAFNNKFDEGEMRIYSELGEKMRFSGKEATCLGVGTGD
jgi:hypothetical protein